MGITSLQVCMDTADWLQQGVIQEERPVDSPPLEDMISCSRPLMERRLRPQPDPSLKCPRCDSTHTKFCYYNNYSLSQPRYFCKTCRRYWTKGGSLRNVPVGGGCRKNKKVQIKKVDPQPFNSINPNHALIPSTASPSGLPSTMTDLNLSFSGVQLTHQDESLLGNSRTNEFSVLGNPRSSEFTVGDVGYSGGAIYNGFLSPNGFGAIDGFHGTNLGYLHTNDRIAFPFEDSEEADMKPRMLNVFNEEASSSVKAEDPSRRLLSLEWHDQSTSYGVGHDSSAYLASLSSLMNNYGLFPMN
ncbi:unnamed protein product [Victoria cruziana]